MDNSLGPNLAQPSDVFEENRGLGLEQYKYVLRYPLNLGTEGLKNYTVFYINVRNRDTTTAYERDTVGFLPPPAGRTRENRIKAEDQKIMESRKGASTLGSMALGASIGRLVGGDGGSGMIGAGIGAVGAGFIESTTGIVEQGIYSGITTESMQIAQLRKAIALPIMSRPSATYKAGWVDVDTGIAGGLLATGALGEAVNNAGALVDSFKEGATTTPSAVLKGMMDNPLLQGAARALLYKKLTGADLLGSGVGEAIEKSTMQTPNPFREQLFRNMGFRTFTFEYTFLPKSRKEAMEIHDIIKTFKYYMHPGLTNQNFFLTYPAEFNIKYFYNGKENEFLHKISSCALTDLAVDYGSGTDFITFRPNNEGQQSGIPTEIALRLTFTELEMLTKERIEQGF